MADEADTFHTEIMAEWPPALSDEFKAAIMAWCEYFVETENFDRSGLHVESRFVHGEAMPSPSRMHECRAFAAKLGRETFYKLKRTTDITSANITKAKDTASHMTVAEAAQFCGKELLPLTRELP